MIYLLIDLIKTSSFCATFDVYCQKQTCTKELRSPACSSALGGRQYQPPWDRRPLLTHTHANLNTRPHCQESSCCLETSQENEAIILYVYQPLLFTTKEQHNMSLALLMMPLYDSNYNPSIEKTNLDYHFSHNYDLFNSWHISLSLCLSVSFSPSPLFSFVHPHSFTYLWYLFILSASGFMCGSTFAEGSVCTDYEPWWTCAHTLNTQTFL